MSNENYTFFEFFFERFTSLFDFEGLSRNFIEIKWYAISFFLK